MDWLMFRSTNGSTPFWPALAKESGDVDRGLCLSVCASMTASVRGPFVRHVGRGLPRWGDVLPLSRHRLPKVLEWLFDDFPDGDDPISVIRRLSRREGPVHHFNDPGILEALVSIVSPSKINGDSFVVPGRLWWTGPVCEWKAQTVQWLVDSGFDEGVDRGRLFAALECLLDDLYRDALCGARKFDDKGKFLNQFVRRRYTPKDGSILPFLRYDVLWADVRSCTGIIQLRPPSNDPENGRLRSQLLNMLTKVQGAGVHHLDYLRMLRTTSLQTGKAIRLGDILSPSSALLDLCK